MIKRFSPSTSPSPSFVRAVQTGRNFLASSSAGMTPSRFASLHKHTTLPSIPVFCPSFAPWPSHSTSTVHVRFHVLLQSRISLLPPAGTGGKRASFGAAPCTCRSDIGESKRILHARVLRQETKTHALFASPLRVML